VQGEPTSCPYRSICSHCPGDDLNQGEWESSLGHKRVTEGILCLDWDVVIPHEVTSTIRDAAPEGRHIVDAVTAADKVDEAQRKYNKSPKFKAALKRYRSTDKGQAANRRFAQSEKSKLVNQRYRFSEKGRSAHETRSKLVKDFRAVARWLKDNPGKTMDDYLKEKFNGT